MATWYLGGLNFQIEHHLFPKICHIYYPAISAMVAATCHEFALPYMLPDRPVGHCGALSLFEAYGETAQCLDSITDERGAGAGVRRGVPAPRAAVEASPGPPVGPEVEAKTLLDAADAAWASCCSNCGRRIHARLGRSGGKERMVAVREVPYDRFRDGQRLAPGVTTRDCR